MTIRDNPVQFFRTYAHDRAAVHERDRLAMRPADRCPSWVVPKASPPGNQRNLRKVERELHRIDPRFRLIHDPLTALGGPGYHLYIENRVNAIAGAPQLIYEMSVQRDPAKDWPLGRPCYPSMSFVQFVRAHLKHDAHSGHEGRQERAEAREQREARADHALTELYYREVFKPAYVRGGLGNTGTSKDLSRLRTNKRRQAESERTRVVHQVGGKGGDRRKKWD